jgi:hypothetical protein
MRASFLQPLGTPWGVAVSVRAFSLLPTLPTPKRDAERTWTAGEAITHTYQS